MTGMAATQTDNTDRFGRTFWRVLLIGSVLLVLSGIAGFGYLLSSGPLTLLAGGARPVAAATTFIPARSPFTFSLLTRPERLIALQQAIVSPERQAQARSEIAQVEQNLFKATGLSYERDIQPWVGNEITFAYTQQDLDQNLDNGQQPGYLLAFEIAPGQQQQAQAFLQLFWQRQILAGQTYSTEQINGVRAVFKTAAVSTAASAGSPITAASALIGDQFMLFANDVRVLRSSIQVAQTAENLAQSPAYREKIQTLPEQRLGLAYLNTALLNTEHSSTAVAPPHFVAMSLAIARGGLRVETSDVSLRGPLSVSALTTTSGVRKPALQAIDTNVLESKSLNYLPDNSELVIASRDLNQLPATLSALGLPSEKLPAFLRINQLSVSDDREVSNDLPANALAVDEAADESINEAISAWPTADYALAQVSSRSGKDWILVVQREADRIEALDQAAVTAGYSAVPVALDNTSSATAWTRLKANAGRRQSGNGLEADLLGLHLQQGGTEIFTNSLAAMNSALAAPGNSLLTSPRFSQATAALGANQKSSDYLYLDWPAVATAAGQALPALRRVQSTAGPLLKHIDAVAATRDGQAVHLFIPLSDRP